MRCPKMRQAVRVGRQILLPRRTESEEERTSSKVSAAEDGKLRIDGLDLRVHLRGDGGAIDLSAQNAEQEPALVRSLGSQVVHPVWCGPEIPTLDLAYKTCNSGIHRYRHSGCMA
jgi:hypothetical protein